MGSDVSQPSPESHAVGSPHRFGDFRAVLAAQPAAQAVREEAIAVLGSVYGAASRAADALPIPNVSAMYASTADVDLCKDEIKNMKEQINTISTTLRQLTDAGGTVDHVFDSQNIINEQLLQLREELDCMTAPRATGDVSLHSQPPGLDGAEGHAGRSLERSARHPCQSSLSVCGPKMATATLLMLTTER